ncbi:hypothetical protein BHM03_00047415 [Ensete ventricosum]|uniref:Uncharacterized protein n=1 Tax=Ensete ventricosum TaxID=4639 RepID=A0A445ML85_ENSVE|nr:hypothetical protein BHM03_00047415 [Ensete ventricosum]
MTHRSSPSSHELPTLGLLLDLAAAAVVFSDLPEPPLPLPPDSGSRICAESVMTKLDDFHIIEDTHRTKLVELCSPRLEPLRILKKRTSRQAGFTEKRSPLALEDNRPTYLALTIAAG